MRALVTEQGTLRFERARPEPQAAAGEARVAVRLAGICATDLEIVSGYMDFAGVPGHEFVGTAKDGALAGRRVVGEINAACGRCDRCARGLDRHCARRTVLGILGRDGAFAETLVLPEKNLLPVPDSVSDEAAVFVEPLAAAFAIREAVSVGPGERVAVLGDGRLGLLCGWVLADGGALVLRIGRHEEKLAHARARGIETACAPRSLDVRFPVVVEATGSKEGLEQALDLVEPRGTVVLKTTVRDPPPRSLARIVIDEIRVVGSRCGRFAPALESLRSGRIDPTPLLEARFPLEQGSAAFARAASGLKVLLEI